MIKARMTTTAGKPVVFLGLSGENVTRLTAGEPIRVDQAAMAELGLPGLEIVLAYGRTEDDIVKDITSQMKARGVRVRTPGEGQGG